MNVSRLLPPSERDATVYRLVVLAGMSTREVAGLARVSQTRVRQIVRRVVRWIAETLPAEAQDISPEKALLAAQHTAAARLEMFYEDAMEAWRKTGQMKYANLALRVTAAQGKLPALSFSIEGLLAGDDENESESNAESLASPIRRGNGPAAAPRPDATQSVRTCDPTPSVGPSITNDQEPRTNDHPPVEGCSANVDSGGRIAESEAIAAVATAAQPKASARLSREKRAARQAFLAAAKPLLSPSAEVPVQELHITPESLELAVKRSNAQGSQRKLSRRERKRLRKAR